MSDFEVIPYDQDTSEPIAVIQGPPGISAYQVWLAQGNTGSEADFLASLATATIPLIIALG